MSSFVVATVAAVTGALSVVQAVMLVVAVVMQQQAAARAAERQRKMQEEAAARADAAKGFQLPVEGEVAALGIAYGRNLIGGARVYHKTFNSFTYVDPRGLGGIVFEASNTLSGGGATGTGISIGSNIWGWSPVAPVVLNATISGSKHEFLMTQQALCFGGINAIYAVDVDGKKINGEYVDANNEVVHPTDVAHLPAGVTKISPYTYGCMSIVYPNGNQVCPTMLANDSSRSGAMFTNTAYATNIYRLNRDDPQFTQGTPSAQFYIEGMKIRSILGVSGARYLSSARAYSNNPALVLIDYLTNTIFGKGLAESDLDLDSFYEAYVVCERVVQTGMPIEGAIWRSKNITHDLKLYECNLTLDSSKSIRDNVELILETMAFSELIWSGGKYKLVLKYPIVWDSGITCLAGETYQYYYGTGLGLFKAVTNSFNAPPADLYGNINSTYWKDALSANITDDDIIRTGETTLSWPNAQSRLNYCSVKFLNEAKDFVEDVASWPPKYGVIAGESVNKGTWVATSAYNKSDIVTYNSKQYQLAFGDTRVNVTTPNIDGAWVLYDINAVYTTYYNQDNKVVLESEAFATGVTDFYHAQAKAEQLVRTSRSSVTYEFSLSKDFMALEPGDIVKVTSDVLNIPGELLRVEEIKPTENGNIRVSGAKFDAKMLAWNAKDNEVVPPRNLYSTTLINILSSDIQYFPNNGNAYITWVDPLKNVLTKSYAIKTALINTGDPLTMDWVDRGQTTSLSFTVGDWYNTDCFVTVIAMNSRGNYAPQSSWPIKSLAYVKPPSITNFKTYVENDGIRLRWDAVIFNRGFVYEVRKGGTNWDSATTVAVLANTEIKLPPALLGPVLYRVKALDINGVYSATDTINGNLIINGSDSGTNIMTGPAAVSVRVEVLDNNVMLYWSPAISPQTIDTYQVRVGANYATSTLIGLKSGLFTTKVEAVSGSYTYWIAGVDIAGNVGSPGNATANVSAPSNYVLRSTEDSSFQNDSNSTVAYSGLTYSDMYVDSSYVSTDYFKAKIDLSNGGSYEETIDIGSVIVNSNVTLNVTYQVISGSPSLNVESCFSQTGTAGTYSAWLSGFTSSMINFRFIKLRLTNSGAGVIRINNLNYTLSTRQVTEEGTVNCYAADVNGTYVPFTKSFIDVSSILPVPRGTIGGSFIVSNYTFNDVQNPTGFYILLFNGMTGARVDGIASYTVEGVT